MLNKYQTSLVLSDFSDKSYMVTQSADADFVVDFCGKKILNVNDPRLRDYKKKYKHSLST